MGVEIERKFLLAGDGWKAGVVRTHRYRDGLLARFGGGKVRVRHAVDRAWLTVKGPREGIARAEFEYEVPVGEAEAMLALCDLPHLEKLRHVVPHGGLDWAVDLYQGALAGVGFAEVELAHPEQPVALPPWAGEEVTHDPRHRKAALLERNAIALRAGAPRAGR